MRADRIRAALEMRLAWDELADFAELEREHMELWHQFREASSANDERIEALERELERQKDGYDYLEQLLEQKDEALRPLAAWRGKLGGNFAMLSAQDVTRAVAALAASAGPQKKDSVLEARNGVLDARNALERVQKGRVWFEPYSDCLTPIIAGMGALDLLAGYDAVREGGGDPMAVRAEPLGSLTEEARKPGAQKLIRALRDGFVGPVNEPDGT